jgi:general secretion pathway protein I
MRARHAGFTLIEVLAALVIVALGMLGAIQAVTQAARNGSYLRDKTLAHWVAMNIITERRLLNAPPDIGESSDDVEMAGLRWRWTMRVTQTQVETMRRMDVSVRPADARDDSSLVTVTGFYGTIIGAAAGAPLTWTGSDQDGKDGKDGEDDKGTEGANPPVNDNANLPGPPPAPPPGNAPAEDE